MDMNFYFIKMAFIHFQFFFLETKFKEMPFPSPHLTIP